MVDTKVAEHRTLRFPTPEQMWTEVDRVVAADRAGNLRRTGNWTTGQCLGHLVTWTNVAYDGYPIKPPWIIKAILRLMKKRYLRGALPRGARIPKIEGGTLGIEPLGLDQGLATFRSEWDRLVK